MHRVDVQNHTPLACVFLSAPQGTLQTWSMPTTVAALHACCSSNTASQSRPQALCTCCSVSCPSHLIIQLLAETLILRAVFPGIFIWKSSHPTFAETLTSYPYIAFSITYSTTSNSILLTASLPHSSVNHMKIRTVSSSSWHRHELNKHTIY